MPKSSSIYVCQQCGYKSPQFLGRCPECDCWNSFVEQIEQGTGSRLQGTVKKVGQAQVVNLADVEKTHYQRLKSGFDEVDRVLGGGIVNGSVVLVAGDPGIGKSTLLTQIALGSSKSLYLAGEESPQQIKIRADRIDPNSHLAVLNETDVDVIAGVIEQMKPSLVIVDSIQTLETQDLNSVPGSVGQVRESTT